MLSVMIIPNKSEVRDMKKAGFILLLLLLPVFQPAWALNADGRTDMGGFARVGYVLMRGAGNAAGVVPFELPGTLAREYRMHPRLWPVTWFPRFFGNVCVRAASIVNDVGLYPFVAPFTNDLSPVTEPFDLPEFPWQSE